MGHAPREGLMFDLILFALACGLAGAVYVWGRQEDRRLRERVRRHDVASAAWVQVEREKLDREVAAGSVTPFARSLLELLLKRIEESTELKVWGSR